MLSIPSSDSVGTKLGCEVAQMEDAITQWLGLPSLLSWSHWPWVGWRTNALHSVFAPMVVPRGGRTCILSFALCAMILEMGSGDF